MVWKKANLSCRSCGSNRLSFPASDDDSVTCDDCGASVLTLREAKALIAGSDGKTPAQRFAFRRARHLDEIEASNTAMRKSIKETDRLVGLSDKMLKRHHRECDDDVG